ncbi:signal peptide peptidase SppA [Helicobacter baculiformis]|uniref:Signal peptide peptidase SppA n=1 Tax=Helicobacter baculiformis TaxID=427351 RepID=A0ABV7ZI83_9HELI|nr:signal peptide peptidase SppA [Helicobacter baculiformis]
MLLDKIFKIITAPLDFITKYFKSLVFLGVLAFFFLGDRHDMHSTPNLATLHLYGPIFESASFQEQIQTILEEPSIKGVLLVIDSPGGSISASVELSDLIAELNKEIPVVAYVRGVMASGSYYAGMMAHKVYANRGALIGSIGVIFEGADVSALMDKLGIKTQGIAKGQYKEVGTFTRAWTSQEKQYLNNLLDAQYQMFVNDVARARHLDPKSAPSFAEGKIFSAQQALDLKLIDKIGTYQQAVSELQTLSGVKKPIWFQKDKWEIFMDKLLKSTSQVLIQTLGYQMR